VRRRIPSRRAGRRARTAAASWSRCPGRVLRRHPPHRDDHHAFGRDLHRLHAREQVPRRTNHPHLGPWRGHAPARPT
jgi:hypothetical protein